MDSDKLISALAKIILAVGIVAALIFFATRPVNIYIDRDGKRYEPVLVPINPNDRPEYEPARPRYPSMQPIPSYPHRPGNKDTGSKGDKDT